MASRTASPLVHPDVEDLDFFQVLSALNDPVRLGIVLTLMQKSDLSCGGFYPNLTPSVLTRHFRILREAGLIVQRDVGVQRHNTLRRGDLDARFPGFIDLVAREGAAAHVGPACEDA